MQALRHRSPQQNGRFVQIQILHRVNVRCAKNLLHSAQHRMLKIRRFKHTACAFLLVRAMMCHPLLTKNLQPKVRPFELTRLGTAGESMRRRA